MNKDLSEQLASEKAFKDKYRAEVGACRAQISTMRAQAGDNFQATEEEVKQETAVRQ